ncbi:MAG: hypothetical protein DMD54_07465 [Gemmatimonadetes bacterium]|nr:MAG: hypothetical protein DMD54_07465 [Gemmatimonadota bacterium]
MCKLCAQMCNKCATTTPQNAAAPPRKTPRNAPECPSPAIQGRSSRSSCAAGR